MSGVVKSVKKTFRKSNLLGKIAVAAAVWWTAGTAMAYFSGPSVTLTQAMSASTESMFSLVSAETGFIGPSEAAANIVGQEAALASAGNTAAAQLAEQNIGLGQAAIQETNAALATEAGKKAGLDSLAGVANAANGGSAAQGIINGSKVAGMTNSQMTGMILGGNALQGAAAADQADEQRKYEDKVRRERGLAGFDYEGNYTGRVSRRASPRPIVQSQMQPKTTAQAVSEPVVAAPTVQSQGVPRPVQKRDLAKLNSQGLIQRNQQAG